MSDELPKMPIREDVQADQNEPAPLKLGIQVRVKGLYTNMLGVLTFDPDWEEGMPIKDMRTPEQVKQVEEAAKGIKKWTTN